MRDTRPYANEVARSALAAFLAPDDLALVLGIAPATARRRVRRGEYGTWIRDGRRIYVARDTFLRAMAAKAETRGSGPAGRMELLPGGPKP